MKDFINYKVFFNGGVPSYSDNYILKIENNPNSNLHRNISKQELKNFYKWKLLTSRFTDEFIVNQFPNVTDYYHSVFTQGISNYITWKGLELCKSSDDISLYIMLLQEMSPKSIVELGTGKGNFNKFAQDIVEKDIKILSFDINGNQLYCDLNDITTLHPYESDIKSLHTPTLFIEDSHKNTLEVIRLLIVQWSTPGCYWYIIEDCNSP
jgi:cephalosporin hydroxylase